MSVISTCNTLATPSTSWPRCFAISKTTAVEEFTEALGEHPCDLAQGGMMGNTVLHQAASVGNVPLIQEIVQRCPELLNMGDNNGETPLFKATCRGNRDAAEELLRLGAQSNIATTGTRSFPRLTTPLFMSVRLKKEDLFRLLRRFGGQANTLSFKTADREFIEGIKQSDINNKVPAKTALVFSWIHSEQLNRLPRDLIRLIIKQIN